MMRLVKHKQNGAIDGIGSPGGPFIDRLAQNGNGAAIAFPRAKPKNGKDSGLECTASATGYELFRFENSRQNYCKRLMDGSRRRCRFFSIGNGRC